MPSRQRGTGLTLMAKKYTNYDEYLQDAYEQQAEKYATIVANERAQETSRTQGT